MIKRFRFLLIQVFFFYSLIVPAQAQTGATTQLINQNKLQYFSYEKEDLGYAKSNKSKDLDSLTLTIRSIKQADFIYNLSLKIPLDKKAIQKGEKLLLSFKARTLESSLETGEARLLWMLNTSDNRKDRKRFTSSIAGQWQAYFIPIEVEKLIKAKDLALLVQFGFPPQQLEIRNLKLEVYCQDIPVSALPKTLIKYQGMESDATWRKAAMARIDSLRKGDLQLQFMKKNTPLTATKVQIELQSPHFSWGAAISAKKMKAEPVQLDYFARLFNLAVFENDLKIKHWYKTDRKDLVLHTIEELSARGVDIKGHVLIWPGFRHLTPAFKANKDDPQEIQNLLAHHLDDILSKTKGKIKSWDVVNEAYTNRDLQKITGSEDILYSGFEALQQRDPQVKRFVNEYGIISKGGIDQKKQQWYYDYIQRIDKNTNAKVDGVGIQCHIGSDLTPPERVLEILDFYAKLGKQISISEFTMAIDDPKVREQYTRDFIIAAYSHPNVSEFLFWGYQTEMADIFNDKLELGSMGKAFYSLVHKNWRTNFGITTNDQGSIYFKRATYGTYQYTITIDNQAYQGTFDFFPGQDKSISIDL